MKNALKPVGRPEVTFEFVAGVATVNLVIRIVQATVAGRSEMIDGEFRSRVTFADAAVPATKTEELP
jgi:hypothetical protein